MKAKNARSRKKVQCTFTSIPENRPILNEPPMRPLLFVAVIECFCRGSAEGEAKSLHPRIEKLDLEVSVADGPRLPDQLVQPLFANRAVALGSVSGLPAAARRYGHEPARRCSSRCRSH